MSDPHHNIAVPRPSWWCARSSAERNVISGLSGPAGQEGVISINVPSDTVADLRALKTKIRLACQLN